MLITLAKDPQSEDIKKLFTLAKNYNLKVAKIEGDSCDVIGLIGDTSKIDENQILANPSVRQVKRVLEPYKLTNRKFHPKDSIIDIKGIKMGGEKIIMIAGPCSVEGSHQIQRIAKEVKEYGADLLRGGAYKPRTSPYMFQGMESKGILALEEAGARCNMPIVSELMDTAQIKEFVEHVDVIQIGARNMQNFALLKAVGKTKKPILLKRGFSNTIQEWIMAAEYILAEGNPNVIFCERGIRTFETATRNTLDLSVIPIIKKKTHLPIVIDPSHAAGEYSLVESLSLAAIAAGADGLMIEVHDDPANAWSDGVQSLTPENYKKLITKGKSVAAAVHRSL